MRKKYISILLIFILCILTISTVNAAEDVISDIGDIAENEEATLEETPVENDLNKANEELILEKSPNEETLNIENENEPLSTTGNFRDLNTLINDNTDPEISLDRDYSYDNDNLVNGIVINRTVTINGNGHTINAYGKARIFRVTSSNVILKNIVFRNGWTDEQGYGGAIWGRTTAINCTFINNLAYYGGAIHEATAINCTFTSNNAAARGGAMHKGTAISCTFLANEANSGGALYESSATNCNFIYNAASNGGAMYSGTANNCSFTANSANDEGGAIYGTNATNCNFTQNTANNGGATKEGNAINCSFTANTANNNGGAIYGTNAINCSFTQNTAYNGGAMLSSNATNCNFTQNTANNNGGAIYGTNAINCSFTANNANNGGAMYSGTANNCSFTQNTAYNGGAMRTGTAINCYFTGNTATEGGALYEATAVNSNFTQNNANHNGGAIWKGAATKCIFTENTAQNSGGALYGSNATDSTFIKNNANNNGGAMLASTATNCNFIQNNARNNGGGMYEGSAKDCNFLVNFATNGYETYRTTLTNCNISTPIIKVANSTVEYNSDMIIPCNLIYDYQFFDGSNITIKIYKNGEYVDTVNVLSGEGWVSNLTPGTYDLTCSLGRSGVEDANAWLEVIPMSTSILKDGDKTTVYNYDDYFQITLVGHNDNPISNAQIYVDLNGIQNYTTDENGQIRVSTKNLSANTHTARIRYEGDEYFNSAMTNLAVIVNKDSTELSAMEITADYNTEEYLTACIKDSQGNPISGLDISVDLFGNATNKTDENGEIKISTQTLAGGIHIAKISFDGNENYTESNATTLVNILKLTPILSVKDVGTYWGETALINITLMYKEGNPISGIVKVEIDEDNIFYIETDNNGEGQVKIIATLDLGMHNIKAHFLGNENYTEAENNSAQLIIKESRELNLEIIPNEVTYGENSKITITATDGRGEGVPIDAVNITLNGVTKECPIDKNGQVNLGILPAGETVITVSVDDGFHQFVEEKLTVKVLPSPNAQIDMRDIDGKLIIKVKDGDNPLEGVVIVFIDDSRGIVISINETGIGELDISNLRPGTHIIKARFSNDNYEEVTTSITLIVPKYTNATVIVVANPIKEGETAIINISVKDGELGLDGLVILTIDDTDYAVNITEGVGSTNIKNLIANEYLIIAKFQGNDFYEEASGESTLTVSMYRPADINIFTRNKNIIVTITDSQGNPVAGEANISIDENTKEYPIRDDGTVIIDSISEGLHNVTVSFQGNDAIAPTNSSRTVFISEDNLLETIITVTAADISYGDKAVIEFNLTDIDGNKLDAVLNVNIGEKNETVNVTNGTGLLTIDGLDADTYPIVANYEENEIYMAATGTGSFKVAKNATKLIFKDMTTTAIDYYKDGRVGQWFKWRLVDANGNPLANTPMEIGFNGVVYNATNGIVTDKNGYAKLQINLMYTGIYTFALCYLGDKNRNGSFVVAKIDVKAQTPTLTVPNKSYKATVKTKALTATFKNNRGSLIANKKVSFTVNGKTYRAKTNAKGVATVNVSISKKGSYTVKAKFAGDYTYAAVTKTATLKIT